MTAITVNLTDSCDYKQSAALQRGSHNAKN